MGELVIFGTPWNVQLYSRVEKEVRREIEVAVELGRTTHRFAPFREEETDDWYLAVFESTEQELVEQMMAAASRYRSLRFKPWRRKQRREVFKAYVRADIRLSVSHGLSTAWI